MSETINLIDENTLEVVKTTTQSKTYTKDELDLRIIELQSQIAFMQDELVQKQALRGQFND